MIHWSHGGVGFSGTHGKGPQAAWRRNGDSKQFCWCRGSKLRKPRWNRCDTTPFAQFNLSNCATCALSGMTFKNSTEANTFRCLCQRVVKLFYYPQLQARAARVWTVAEAKKSFLWQTGPRTVQSDWNIADLLHSWCRCTVLAWLEF